jgi:hypothetical protein
MPPHHHINHHQHAAVALIKLCCLLLHRLPCRIGLSFAAIFVLWDMKPVFYALWSPFDWLVGYTDPRKPAGQDRLHGKAPCRLAQLAHRSRIVSYSDRYQRWRVAAAGSLMAANCLATAATHAGSSSMSLSCKHYMYRHAVLSSNGEGS